MPHRVTGIDHCLSIVEDLDAAATQFATLGFTLSPRGKHSEEKGSANYTIMFPDDYFELLGLLYETPLNAARSEMLRRHGEGLHGIACRVADARKARAALAEAGLATENLSDFDRPVSLPDGGNGTAAFSTLNFAPEEVPRGIVFMCQHRTPETVWLPGLLEHANTACGLAGIVLRSNAPAEDAHRFARLWTDGVATPIAGGAMVYTGAGSAPLTLLTTEAWTARYPGLASAALAGAAFDVLQIKIRQRASLLAVLDGAGATWVETAQGVAVGPDQAAGAIVEFIAR